MMGTRNPASKRFQEVEFRNSEVRLRDQKTQMRSQRRDFDRLMGLES